jgi:hypothetical protein
VSPRGAAALRGVLDEIAGLVAMLSVSPPEPVLVPLVQPTTPPPIEEEQPVAEDNIRLSSLADDFDDAAEPLSAGLSFADLSEDFQE